MTLIQEIQSATEFGLDRKFVLQAKWNADLVDSPYYYQFGKYQLYRVYDCWPVTYKEIIGENIVERILPPFESEKEEFTFWYNHWVRMKNVWLKRGRPVDDINEEIERYQKKLKRIATKDSPFLPERRSFDLEQIKRTDIVQMAKYAGLYPLAAGTNRYKCRCPFHNEKSPSFVLYADENTYHCFGCQANGDAINLYMRLNNCSFVEACKALQ